MPAACEHADNFRQDSQDGQDLNIGLYHPVNPVHPVHYACGGLRCWWVRWSSTKPPEQIAFLTKPSSRHRSLHTPAAPSLSHRDREAARGCSAMQAVASGSGGAHYDY